MCSAQSNGCAPIHRGPALCCTFPGGLLNLVGVLAAQTLDKFAGVNAHRTRPQTHRVHGTSLLAHVFIVFIQLGDRDEVTLVLRLGTRATHHDALARGQRQILRWTHGFTIAALDAGIDFFFHAGVELDIANMRRGVFIQNDTGV